MSIFGWFRRRSASGGQGSATTVVAEAQGEFSPAMMVAGRLRTVGVPYALPRDTEEVNRLDFQHYMLRYAFQGLYAAPVDQPASILDVGTGTGRWAMEVAQIFPQARVIGLDVTPPPADQRADQGLDIRPPNYTFMPGNMLEGLPIADNVYNYVHMRLLFTAIPADRWPFVISELVRVASPGGWIESVESGNLQQTGPAFGRVQGWLNQVLARRGVEIDAGKEVGHMLAAAGLANVKSFTINLPTGPYGGRLGTMMAQDILSAFNALRGLVTSSGLASEADFEQTMAAARVELNAPDCHTVTPFYIAYAQKPA